MGILTIALMFGTTTYMRQQANTRTSSMQNMIERVKDGETVTISEAEFALKRDESSAASLYRKIWTYDALIFLSGMLLIYLLGGQVTRKPKA